MAAKGTQSKIDAAKKILDIFPNSFQYDKEIRIPYTEDGTEIQLKCVLTCAKTNVEPNSDAAIPGEANDTPTTAATQKNETPIEVTQEEKDNVKRLMDVLGL